MRFIALIVALKLIDFPPCRSVIYTRPIKRRASVAALLPLLPRRSGAEAGLIRARVSATPIGTIFCGVCLPPSRSSPACFRSSPSSCWSSTTCNSGRRPGKRPHDHADDGRSTPRSHKRRRWRCAFARSNSSTAARFTTMYQLRVGSGSLLLAWACLDVHDCLKYSIRKCCNLSPKPCPPRL